MEWLLIVLAGMPTVCYVVYRLMQIGGDWLANRNYCRHLTAMQRPDRCQLGYGWCVLRPGHPGWCEVAGGPTDSLNDDWT